MNTPHTANNHPSLSSTSPQASTSNQMSVSQEPSTTSASLNSASFTPSSMGASSSAQGSVLTEDEEDLRTTLKAGIIQFMWETPFRMDDTSSFVSSAGVISQLYGWLEITSE